MKKSMILAGVLCVLSGAPSVHAASIEDLTPVSDEIVVRDEDTFPGALLQESLYNGLAAQAADRVGRSTFQVQVMNPKIPALQLPSCTATLITKDILLSAGHCFSNPNLKVLIKYVSPITGRQEKIEAAEIRVHENYKEVTTSSGDDVLNDIALIRLKKAVPIGAPAVLPRTDLRIPSRLQVLVAGYGNNGREISKEELLQDPRVIALQKKAQGKLSKEEQVNAMAELISIITERPLMSSIHEATLQNTQDAGRLPEMVLKGENSICSGDSGGPTYLRTETERLVVIGVHSTSRNAGCKEPGGWFFNKKQTIAYDLYVPFYTEWIKRTARAMGSQQDL